MISMIHCQKTNLRERPSVGLIGIEAQELYQFRSMRFNRELFISFPLLNCARAELKPLMSNKLRDRKMHVDALLPNMITQGLRVDRVVPQGPKVGGNR